MKSTFFLAILGPASIAVAGVLSARDAEDSDVFALGDEDSHDDHVVDPLSAGEEAVSTVDAAERMYFKNKGGGVEYFIERLGQGNAGDLFYTIQHLDTDGRPAKHRRICCKADSCCKGRGCKWCVYQ